MKLGILVESEEGLDWDGWRRTFRAAERLGFESIWISDHLQSPWDSRRHGLDAWTALAVAAAETERLVLGPLVSPITFREPAIVARMAESLDELTHGRFVIGLGLGWNAEEHRAAGISFPSSENRANRLRFGIERIRAELGERHVPILIGGRGQKTTLPVVAMYADEWNLTTSSVLEYTAAAVELNRECSAIGRDPHHIRHSIAAGVLLGDRAERMRGVVPALASAPDVVKAARDLGWLAGTPDEVATQAEELAIAGVQRLIFGHYDLDDVALLEQIVGHVR